MHDLMYDLMFDLMYILCINHMHDLVHDHIHIYTHTHIYTYICHPHTHTHTYTYTDSPLWACNSTYSTLPYSSKYRRIKSSVALAGRPFACSVRASWSVASSCSVAASRLNSISESDLYCTEIMTVESVCVQE